MRMHLRILLILFLLICLPPVRSSILNGPSASSFLGGSGDDGFYTISVAVDSGGNIYVAGDTASRDFPTTPGSFDTTHNGDKDIFVAKFDPSLTRLLAATYLGGSGEDFGCELKIDRNGDVIVAGQTSSTNFPTADNAYSENYNGGDKDVFIAKLSSDLTTLIGSTYLGGSQKDNALTSFIALDEENNIYITCYTESSNYPVTEGSYDTSYNSQGDAAVTKIDSSLTRIIASTYIGAEGNDWSYAIVYSQSRVYVTGHTDSRRFPVSGDAHDRSYNGGVDVFICTLDTDLKTLIGSTFLGGDLFDSGSTLILEPQGDVIVSGITASRNFPTTENSYSEDYNGGDRDIFVSRLDQGLSSLKHTTLLGGSDNDIAPQLLLFKDEAIVLTGTTRSSNFPVTDSGFNGGSSDNILCIFDSQLSELKDSVAIGGSGEEKYGGITSYDDFLIIASSTKSTNLEISDTGYDSTHNGGLDAYIFKLPLDALEISTQESEPSSSEPQPTTPSTSGDGFRIPGFPAYSLVIGLLLAIILISFKRRMVHPTHR